MNKNALDDTIEMISLDDVSSNTMEISFDEMQEPNPALGADVEMVMQNTRVFSTEELDAVLQKNLETLVESNEIGETRVIDSSIIEDKISETNENLPDSDSELDESEETEIFEEEDEDSEEDFEDLEEAEDENDYEFDDSDDDEVPSKKEVPYEEDSEEDDAEEDEAEDESEDEEDEEEAESSEEDSEEEDADDSEESEDDAEEDAVEEDEEDPDDIDGGDENLSKTTPETNKTTKSADKFVPSSVKKKANAKKKAQKKKEAKKAPKKSFADFIKNLGAFEYAAVVIGLVIVGLVVALCVRLVGSNKKADELEKFASVGFMFENMDGIGNKGVEAMSTKAQVDSLAAEKEREAAEAKEKEEKEEEEEEEIVSQATVNFSSVEKDLKIKFVDKATGKPITGVKFEVTAKGPDGKTYSWVDSDMDGIIYEEQLTPGNYEVTIVSVEPYKFPETASVVKVQDTIVYQAINIMDEVVDMKDVDLSKEESLVKEVEVGTVLSDTVAWVESTKTLISGVDGYKEISKSEVTSPYSESQAFLSGFMKVDGTEIILGEEKEVGLPDDKKHSDAFSVEYEWTFSADVLNKVSGGETGDTFIKVSVKDGVAENTNASVSCTIKYNQNEGEGEPVQDNFTGALTVKAPAPILPDGITINDGPSELTVGGATITLTANVTPDTAIDKAVTWSSSNEAIAKVDAATGVVTAVAPGTADIIASVTSKPSLQNKKTVTVKAAPVPITMTVKDQKGNELASSSTIQLIVGMTHQISVTASESAGGYTITTNNNAVTVSESGLISAQTNGTVTVTVQSKNADSSGNKVSKTFNVKVYKDSNLTSGGKEVYVKSGENAYRIATAKDYDTTDKFYVKTPAEYKYTGWNTVDGKVMYFDANGKFVTGEQIIQGAKYNFASDGALTMGGGSRGIDVSYYQGTIDWNAVKDSGISFVIIRCGFRGYGTGKLVMDDKYVSYIKGASAAGLRVGLYIFSQAVNEVEAVEEASFCVSMAQGYSISYPIFIDSEISGGRGSGRADNLSKEQRTAVCKAFCETIRSSGYTPGVYASKSWFRNKLDYDQLSGYKIWLAHYCTATDYDKRYDMWQHSSTGSVNGIKGNVDLDISYLGY